MPLTVTNLARACNLSRSTLLYYESIGLLPRPRRTTGNYRAYTPKDADRLRQVCVYRDAGVPLADIRSLLDGPRDDAANLLRRRLVELSAGIERLRDQQRAIARLLKSANQKPGAPEAEARASADAALGCTPKRRRSIQPCATDITPV